MSSHLASGILFALSTAWAESSPELSAAAWQHLNAARFEDAAKGYAQLIEANPADASAYYGRVRALLEAHQSAKAFEAADLALKNAPGTAPAEAAAGKADMRRGDILSAERHFLAARKLDPQSSAAMSGLAHVYSTVSLPRRAREMSGAAWRASPTDSDLMLAWANTLQGNEHLAALERALSLLDPSTEVAQAVRAHLARDRAAGDRKLRRLTSPYTSARIRLTPIMDGPKIQRGYGIQVKLNGRTNVILLLDTGASGIAVSPKTAARAGLQVLSLETTPTKGIGDSAPQSSLTYLAPEVQVGGVVFADYPIRVFQSAKSSDIDGLIGADVFQRFIVGIDFANSEIQLEPRPGDNDDTSSQPVDRSEKLSAGFYRVYRADNYLLIPTLVNEKRSVLFMIDSGSTANLMDTQAAREFTGVAKESTRSVRGIQGKVNEASLARKAVLAFAGFRQENSDLLAIPLDKVSDSLGIGVSGILGMPVLSHMKLTIDYREGAVRFEYKR